eukprot:COSAG02_NODE_573_length_20153_cov_11.609305_14_plen_97_part_00
MREWRSIRAITDGVMIIELMRRVVDTPHNNTSFKSFVCICRHVSPRCGKIRRPCNIMRSTFSFRLWFIELRSVTVNAGLHLRERYLSVRICHCDGK